MKKFVLYLIVFVLLLSNLLPFQTFAAAIDNSIHSQHIALGKEIFPEYADKLDENANTQRRIQNSETSELIIVNQKTRPVDRNTTMTYTEYNNGIVTLGTARFSTNEEINVEDTVYYGSYTQYTVEIVASVVEGPTFTATGVKYRIYPNAYDQVIDIGSYSIPGYTADQFDTFLRSNETASLFACASYDFPCPVGLSSYSGEVILKVQRNNATVEFNIW